MMPDKIKSDNYLEIINELKSQNNLLQETLHKERDMLDILGHELRTPLTIAKNAILMLEKLRTSNTLTHDAFDKYISMAQENLVRESKLLELLLSTTKIDNNALDLNIVKVDFLDVVNDSFDGLSAKAERKGLELTFNKPEKCFIEADRTRIQEVIDNLLDNAIKYTQHGSVTVTLQIVGEEAKLDITDTGFGISVKELHLLGKKFYRTNTYLESSKESNYSIVRPGGTGLGLYVSFNLVKKMGGRVLVTSELGKGSTFTVFMPIFKEVTHVEKILNEDGINGDGRNSGGEDAPRMTVFEKFQKMKEKQKQMKPQDANSTDNATSI